MMQFSRDRIDDGEQGNLLEDSRPWVKAKLMVSIGLIGTLTATVALSVIFRNPETFSFLVLFALLGLVFCLPAAVLCVGAFVAMLITRGRSETGTTVIYVIGLSGCVVAGINLLFSLMLGVLVLLR